MTPHTRLQKNEHVIAWTFGVSMTLICILGIVGFLIRPVFLFNGILGAAGLLLIYTYRRYLLFAWEGAILGAAGMVMNSAGAIGAYEISYYGVGWDKFLHIVTVAGITILAYAYMNKKHHQISPLEKALLVICIVEGIGAINEIVEFFGSEYFGVGQGLFGQRNGITTLNITFENYDTQWDLIANTLGAASGLAYIGLKSILTKKASTTHQAIAAKRHARKISTE